MKKKEPPDLDDDLRSEYPRQFFRDMKPNRFAGTDLKFKGRPPIRLDEDVAAVFDSPEAVNSFLRSAIKAMRAAMPASAKAAAKGPASPGIATKRRAS